MLASWPAGQSVKSNDLGRRQAWGSSDLPFVRHFGVSRNPCLYFWPAPQLASIPAGQATRSPTFSPGYIEQPLHHLDVPAIREEQNHVVVAQDHRVVVGDENLLATGDRGDRRAFG